MRKCLYHPLLHPWYYIGWTPTNKVHSDLSLAELCSPSSSTLHMSLFSPLPLSFILFLSTSFILSTLSLNEEVISLLSFKNSIKQDPSNSFKNWNFSNPNPCFWNGITCKDSKVISLSIPKSNLYGFISPSLFSLPSLRHINLRNNRLYGSLPSILSNLSGLQSLVLYGNSLYGPLPFDIGKLSNLQILDLSKNFFNGSVPTSLNRCKRLKTLDLSHNNFTGSLPVGFGSSLVQVEKLDLSYNEFNGSIPADIGKLSNLQGTADFSHNMFSGSIPASLGNLPEKVYIDLTYNNLSGSIPQNGALENRGPTAFIGNPGLCGPPLKNPCSSSGTANNPFLPTNNPPSRSEESNNHPSGSRTKGLGKGAVAAIVVSDVVGIGLIALMFFYCYRRAISKEESGSLKGPKSRKECLCFTKEESETQSDNADHHELVPLDKHVGIELDELLKASAFVLGKSGIGIVYKVVLEDGLTFAVRRLGEGGSQRFKEFQTEVEAIGKVRHPNIVALRAYYWSINEKLLIYDYIPNGNLSFALHGRTGTVAFQPLSWDRRIKIMHGIAKGLSHLHEVSPKKYVHGDLQPNNILLGLKMEPYISDFGISRLANIARSSPLLQSDQIDVTLSPVISIASCYQAPEALKTLKPSQKWDIYSYGIILLELISGRSPIVLMETSEMDLVRWVQLCIEEKKLLSDVLDPFLSDELDRKEDEIIAVLKIALTCVQVNPERRPSMKNVADTLARLVNA